MPPPSRLLTAPGNGLANGAWYAALFPLLVWAPKLFYPSSFLFHPLLRTPATARSLDLDCGAQLDCQVRPWIHSVS